MKTRCFALVLLVSSVAFAQTPSATPKAAAAPAAKSQAASAPASKPAATPAPTPVEVAADAQVLTITGLCDAKTPKGAECKTVYTRAQFDKLVASFFGEDQGPVPVQAKRRLATQLVHNMIFTQAAEKQNLEKNPDYPQLMTWVKMQVMAELERRVIAKESEPKPAEIQKYYDENQDRYTDLVFDRLMIPIHLGADAKLNEADLKKIADEMRERAVKGADFKTLESEAYDKLSMKSPPETKLTLRPNEISASLQAAKQLKPGEVSEVIKDANGYYVFKLNEKKVMPLDEKMKTEIKKTLAPQNSKKATDEMENSAKADYNSDYFGAAPPSGPGPGMGRAPMAPPRPPTPPMAPPPAALAKPAAPAAKPATPPPAPPAPAK